MFYTLGHLICNMHFPRKQVFYLAALISILVFLSLYSTARASPMMPSVKPTENSETEVEDGLPYNEVQDVLNMDTIFLLANSNESATNSGESDELSGEVSIEISDNEKELGKESSGNPFSVALSDVVEFTNFFYDYSSCIRLYRMENFPKASSNREVKKTESIFIFDTNFSSEIIRCLRTAANLRDEGLPVEIKSISLSITPPPPDVEEESERVKQYLELSLDLNSIYEGITMKYLDGVADALFSVSACSQKYEDELMAKYTGSYPRDYSDIGVDYRFFLYYVWSCENNYLSRMFNDKSGFKEKVLSESARRMDQDFNIESFWNQQQSGTMSNIPTAVELETSSSLTGSFPVHDAPSTNAVKDVIETASDNSDDFDNLVDPEADEGVSHICPSGKYNAELLFRLYFCTVIPALFLFCAFLLARCSTKLRELLDNQHKLHNIIATYWDIHSMLEMIEAAARNKDLGGMK